MRTDGPHVTLVTKDGDRFALPTTAYADILPLWMNGETFWVGTDLWDQPFAIRLAHVILIVLRTPESCKLADEEEAEKRRRSMMHGDDE